MQLINPIYYCHVYPPREFGFFGIIGFYVLLAAQAMLLYRIRKSRSCIGISGKTQILYACLLSGMCVEWDQSICMNMVVLGISKVVLIILSYGIVYSIFFTYKESNERQYDKLRLVLLVLPSFLAATMIYNDTSDYTFWIFGMLLEAWAIMPQFHFIRKSGRIEKFVYRYICLLTMSKAFFVLDQSINNFSHSGLVGRTSITTGVIMLLFCCDFFIYTRKWKKEKLNGEFGGETYVRPNGSDETSEPKVDVQNTDMYNDNLREIVLAPNLLQQKDAKMDTPHVHKRNGTLN